MQVRRCIDAQHGGDGIRGMHRNFNLAREGSQKVPLETFRDGIADALKKEGTLKLLQAKQDHNVCPECKSKCTSAAFAWVKEMHVGCAAYAVS